MHKRLYRSAISSTLAALLVLFTTQSLAYTNEELKAFAEFENQMTQDNSISKQWNTDDIHEQSSLFRQQALDATRKVQALVKQESLSPLLNLEAQPKNPNQTPKGVMVFVSLTMPTNTLRQLLRQSERLGVPLIIRGVLPQGFPATVNRIESLIRSESKPPIKSGFSISPDWFKQFDIKHVPAFVSIKPDKCLPKQPCREEDFDILYGNISLYQALDYLAEGDASQNIPPLLNALYSTQ
ncbi:type-F conjugative transfer system pilin assembly protein TrbC [Vibrio sinaloensis]|uniref:type-F conjugative transfer system pilin assembly protein TrbC n=1 Tax=Photobacterium sp. (strain ATCC 43367) TaxID=379097 RepID=UPI0035ED7ABD